MADNQNREIIDWLALQNYPDLQSHSIDNDLLRWKLILFEVGITSVRNHNMYSKNNPLNHKIFSENYISVTAFKRV